MSLRDILLDWITGGVEPDRTGDLSPADQRQFTADIYTEVPDHLYDALIETLVRSPQIRSSLVAAYRDGDFLQVGAVLDKALRAYVIGSPFIENEMREAKEQESEYAEDY
jgi:hypothetical protein